MYKNWTFDRSVLFFLQGNRYELGIDVGESRILHLSADDPASVNDTVGYSGQYLTHIILISKCFFYLLLSVQNKYFKGMHKGYTYCIVNFLL